MNRYLQSVVFRILATICNVTLATAAPSVLGPYVATTSATADHGEVASFVSGTESAIAPVPNNLVATYISPAAARATVTPSAHMVSVSASAPPTDTVGDSYGASASAQLTYNVEVSTLFYNEPVPLNFAGDLAGQVKAGGNVAGYATISISDSNGNTLVDLNSTSDPGLYHGALGVMPNVPYTVVLDATATASSRTGDASAFSDPIFTLDAPYASEAQVIVSDGIGNDDNGSAGSGGDGTGTSSGTTVPEPGTFSLLLFIAGMLGWLRLRAPIR